MQILAALFIDDMDMRQVPGPATRIDLRGVQFSGASPQPLPYTWAPHLVVLVGCPPDHRGVAALEVVFRWRGGEEAEPIARNVQPLQIEPGKFGRQLVRPEVTFETFATVEAHCRIDQGPTTVVPYTLLPPV
jgi:hypothetical protein